MSEYEEMSVSELKCRIYQDSKLLKQPSVRSSSLIQQAVLQDKANCESELYKQKVTTTV